MNRKTSTNFFEVDKEGLAKILKPKGKAFLLFELIQNAWDQNVKRVDIKFEKPPREKRAVLSVTDDDPAGFADLSHIYTLFAESAKKKDPTKRGRFNLGDKLVLAICKNARISSTTGTITFDDRQGRKKLRQKRETGSEFSAEVPINNDDFKSVCREVNRLIPPEGIDTYFNGRKLKSRIPVAKFEYILPTVISDDNGYLKSSKRKTIVRVYQPHDDEKASIYEMGIPVVETGDKYHVDVGQKIPLTLDRTNLSPSFLRTLRTIVYSHTYALLDKAEAAEPWVREATANTLCSEKAFKKAVENRFGEKSVIYDPSDKEANKRAMAAAYNVVSGGSLSKGEWENVKRLGIMLPAGQVTPSPKPYSQDGRPENIIPQSDWTEGMKRIVEFACRLAYKLLKKKIKVNIVDEPFAPWEANYGTSKLTLSLGTLGERWFSDFPQNLEQVINLLIHEFAHEYESDHLSKNFYSALTSLAAKSIMLALKQPDIFRIDNQS